MPPPPPMGFGGMGRGVPTFTGNSYAFQQAMNQLMPSHGIAGAASTGGVPPTALFNLISGFKLNRLYVLSRLGESKFGTRLKAAGIAIAKGATNFAFEADFLTKLEIAKKDLDSGKIDKATWARRIMKAAKTYYSYLKNILYYTEEDYRADMINFAAANGIEFHFSEEERTRRR